MDVDDMATLVLPSVLDLKSVGGLHADLLAVRGRPVTLDASQVSRLGGLGLQVLLAARTTWAEDAQPFAVVNPSEDFSGALGLFGAPGLEPVASDGADLSAADSNAVDAREHRS
jgi:chemotaxis protein CheX